MKQAARSEDRSKDGRLRVGISGSYGGFNLGDEAILAGMIEEPEVRAWEGGRQLTYYEWRAVDMQITLRLARKDGAWIVNYKHVKLRRLPAELFELPPRYRPVD